MQLQSLFANPKEIDQTNNFNFVDLNISRIVEEINEYLEEIQTLSQIGFVFSRETKKFRYSKEVIPGTFFGMLISNLMLDTLVPGSFGIKMLLMLGLTGTIAYKFLSKKNGLFKKRIKYVENKTQTLEALLKNDVFKVSLIVNIEKDFQTLEDKFQSKPETLSMIQKKKSDIIKDLKKLLIEEDLNTLQLLLGYLTNIKGIEEQTQKLLKLDNLNQEVAKQLNGEVIDSPEENELPAKLKALL